MATPHDILDPFNWQPQPDAQALVDNLVEGFFSRCAPAKNLGRLMKHRAGTRFKDWVDFIGVQRTASMESRLAQAGFERTPLPGAPECYTNSRGLFPPILLEGAPLMRVGIKVDSVADFMAVQHLEDDHPILGEPLSQLRMGKAFEGEQAELWAVERHGYRGFEIRSPTPAQGVRFLHHLEAFRRRRRDGDTDDVGWTHLEELVEAAVSDLGPDWACDAFFYAEREFWQRRNRAAQVQYARQQLLGLGWANHDHHTYRSSRESFARLMKVWLRLGFKPRERFYAGHEAGWGAQVMEQPVTGITTFNDVDLSPDELAGDLLGTPLPPRRELGTVGLWVGLHGEAILQAGMHHLECMFDWEALVEQLEREAHVKTMAPFTTFPYLRQAFTEGEMWTVAEKRLARLLENGQLTEREAAVFRSQGALGSHLENLERNDGFKGFNQQGVSDIISRTNPRKKQAPVLAGA